MIKTVLNKLTNLDKVCMRKTSKITFLRCRILTQVIKRISYNANIVTATRTVRWLLYLCLQLFNSYHYKTTGRGDGIGLLSVALVVKFLNTPRYLVGLQWRHLVITVKMDVDPDKKSSRSFLVYEHF